MQQPLVFLLDIDGTIIGDVRGQLSIYELKQQNIHINYSQKDLFHRFDQGLLRPYFDTFLKQVKRRIPNAEFFIYTAADDKWGTFMANTLEKYTSVKFNRPIFTRKHCMFVDNSLRKSLSIVHPHVKRVMQRKYGRHVDLTNRTLIVDNTRVFDAQDSKSMLLCPTYNVTLLENLPALINEETFLRNKHVIQEKLVKYFPQISSTPMNTYLDFQRVFYSHYLQYLNKRMQNQDKFWFFLARLLEIKNINVFTPTVVQYLNSKLQKRLT